MSIEKALRFLSKRQLSCLLLRLYGKYSYINDIIDQYVEEVLIDQDGDETQKVFNSIYRQIRSYASESEFIDWQSVYGFVEELQALLNDINTRMRQLHEGKALMLLEVLLDSCEDICSHCDDSDGEISRFFKRSIDVWLDVAAQVRSKSSQDNVDWVAKVLFYFDHNDYGCYDDIISHSYVLLSEAELRQLAWRFEHQLQRAVSLDSSDFPGLLGLNRNVSLAVNGLKSVAEALTDISLFESATFLGNDKATQAQMSSVVEFALDIENYERARFWLDQPGWDTSGEQHRAFTLQLLQAKGDVDQIKQGLRSEFEADPSYSRLVAYWKIASAEELPLIQETVNILARQMTDANDAINMLLLIGNVQTAAEVLVSAGNYVQLSDKHMIRDWLVSFEQHQQALAMVICYRALLDSILNMEQSQYYTQAIEYLRRLSELDNDELDYQELENHPQYLQQLQNRHWRQRSFWKRTGCPKNMV
ncbi:DUF6880 family protein [Gynuella sunshinyii]|uniref:Uncharacterized protein n=1 Tax=Gynuella sunshinyii YC6258 TaxID=1445510 RepID=A0A0C5VSM8_9GAMM|nr:DUF6880 family protein [Gynuella sunshinyii]AJQ97687.1 hypothetical Protein YC6258_05659 [Gynuella sunshinyii YC6258]